MTCHLKSGAGCDPGAEPAARRLLPVTRPLFDILASSCAAMATPAAAQDTQTSGRNVVIGAGIEVVPKYPGASSGRIGVLPLIDIWRADAPRPARRLRGELRHGIGGHRALTGDLGADAVWRGAGDGIMLTIGPRVRWGSGKYNRAFLPIAPVSRRLTPDPGSTAMARRRGCGCR